MKLTIITTCLNEFNSINQTLRSINLQTWNDFQLIIVDGGSTDGTITIINKYKHIIDIFISEKDNGIYDAMNKGLKHSKGEYILFLNGGDFLLNKSTLHDIMKKNIYGDIVYGDIVVKDNNTYNILYMPPNLTTDFLYIKTLPHQSTFTKKSLFDTCGYYNTSFKIASDYLFTLKAITKHKASTQHIDIPVACFLRNGISSNNREREREKLFIKKIIFSITERIILNIRSRSIKIRKEKFDTENTFCVLSKQNMTIRKKITVCKTTKF